MKPLSECHLYGFVDTSYLRGRSPGLVGEQLCDGGADLIQLRAKELPLSEVRRLAQALLAVTSKAGVGLVVNDYPKIAAEIGAAYCHLGQEDFFEEGRHEVATLNMPSLGLGLSTHAPDQALRAVSAGAHYLGIGPVYPTDTKPTARPVTLEYVRWAADHVGIPWFAIGGINLGNLDEVLMAGARRICVVSAILNAPDIAKACREFAKRLRV